MRFKASETNEKGERFVFIFENPNWSGITEIAEKRLNEIVAGDPLHQRHGPWKASNIDVTA